VDPWGEIVAEADEMPGIVIADIDPARVFEARGSVPSLTNARDYRPVDGVRPSVE
jgi:predicted amidohydrolase